MDGGSPKGDWSPCRRGGGRGGLLGAGAAVERQPEARRGAAAAAWRIAWRRCPVRRAWRSCRLEAWRERAMGAPRARLKGSSRRARGGDASTRRSVTSGSCRWRSSCSASGPGPRSSASLWRCGGRDDERDDLRGDGALFRHPAGVIRSGSARARRSTRGGRGHTTTGWARGRRGGGRCRGNRTRSCWR